MAGFVDEAQVHLKAGNGGAGAVSFRREAHVARGGPDGGDGGNGGNVFLEASHDVVSLLSFADHPHRRGEDGEHGGGKKRHGRSAHDLIVKVPEGTIVRTLDGEVLADLAHDGDRLIAAEGGVGGRGNARFLSNRLRAPSFAEQGEFGEERWLNLELKLLADVALVGFPNVGKSTLVSRVSAAKPKIADYPFTTLEPHLGVVRLGGERDGTEFTIADIPGLIEGASDGKGLGFDFLRHIERARVLLVLADLSPLAEHARSRAGRDLARRARPLPTGAPRPATGHRRISQRPRRGRGDASTAQICRSRRSPAKASPSSSDASRRSSMRRATRRRSRSTGGAPPRRRGVRDRARRRRIRRHRARGTAGGRSLGPERPRRARARPAPAARPRRRPGASRAGGATGDTVRIGKLSFTWTADGDTGAIGVDERRDEDER